MVQDPNVEARAIVKDACDEALGVHEVRTIEELADLYGLSTKTVSFIRNGRWTRVVRFTIAVMLRQRLDRPAA